MQDYDDLIYYVLQLYDVTELLFLHYFICMSHVYEYCYHEKFKVNYLFYGLILASHEV